MSIKVFKHRLDSYLGSDEWKEDVAASTVSNGYQWLDIGFRLGLCSGCVSIGGKERLIFFNVMFLINDGKLIKEEEYKFHEAIQKWSCTIERIYEIMASEDFHQVIEKGRGYMVFEPVIKDGGMDYLDLKYNRSLVDYLLRFDVWSKDMVQDKIRIIKDIDDELYDIGKVFCDNLPSVIHSRYFRLYKDPGTGKYCFKFEYSLDFGLDEIDPHLSILFNSRNKLYVKDVKELETIMELVK